jgi:hypothetical protein
MVPAYQPETAFQVFYRIITGTSVSTGEIVDLSVYNTSGPALASHSEPLPSSPSNTCWIRNIPGSCTDGQKNMILNNQGVIINGVLYDAASDYPGYSTTQTSSQISVPTGTYTTVTQILTGAYTATATPKSGATGREINSSMLRFICLWILVMVFST